MQSHLILKLVGLVIPYTNSLHIKAVEAKNRCLRICQEKIFIPQSIFYKRRGLGGFTDVRQKKPDSGLIESSC